MFVQVEEVAAETERLVRALDPELLDPHDAVRLLTTWARLAKLAAAGVAVLAGRADDAAPWKATGCADTADWLARQTGGYRNDGRRLLDVSNGLHHAPAATEELLAGRLSITQAGDIIGAVTRRQQQEEERRRQEAAPPPPEEREQPDDAPSPAPAPLPAGKTAEEIERELLRKAADANATQLRHERERLEASMRAEAEQRRYLHNSRYHRRRRYADGGTGGEYKLTPELDAVLQALLEAETDRVFAEARAEGRHEPRDAYAADALCRLLGIRPEATETTETTETAEGPGGGVPPGAAPDAEVKVEMIVRADLPALLRGHTEAGEVCEVPGYGPVPVGWARSLLGASLLNLVLSDGVDIRTVALTGRKGSKALRLAVFERDPYCMRCGTPFRLELDHDTPEALGGLLSYDNAQPLCRRCHQDKTRRQAPLTIPAGRARAVQRRAGLATNGP